MDQNLTPTNADQTPAPTNLNQTLIPTPLEVTSNIVNQQASPLSLRIKDSTRVLFEQEAKKRELTLSGFINNLLDDYAKRYIADQNLQAETNHQILLRYIDTVAKKAATLDFETLLRDLVGEYHKHVDTNEHHLPSSDPDGELFLRDIVMYAKGYPARLFDPKKDEPCIYTADGYIYMEPPKSIPNISTELDYTIDFQQEITAQIRKIKADGIQEYLVGGGCISLSLPARHWIAVCTLIAATEQRAKQLLGVTPYLGENTYRTIAYLVLAAPDFNTFVEKVAKRIKFIINRHYKNLEN